ncbi:MAG: hypothetical protein DRP01_02280, partial [Archaeoglobales archaeon]
FKTFSSFPKDIADIDLLLYSTKDLTQAEETLKSLGYVRRKVGLEQHLWGRVRDSVIVDIELHTSISAAGYEYYPKELLFKRATKLNCIRVPSPIDSILVLVAHAVVKDLYITLADLLNFAITLKRHGVKFENLAKEAGKIGLLLPLQVFLYLLQILGEREMLNIDKLPKLLVAMKLRSIPLRPALHTVVLSYVHLTTRKMLKDPLMKVIHEVTSLPRGKGIDTFTKYILGLSPSVKKLQE